MVIGIRSRHRASTVGEVNTLYDRVGGDSFFETLTDRFYAAVVTDPVLRPLYPNDLAASKEHLRLFLIQYWGGPASYSELRGHPRLRMRHVHFAIGPAERDAWLRHMRTALDELELDPAHDAQLWEYLVMAAHSLVNQPGDRSGGPDLGLSLA